MCKNMLLYKEIIKILNDLGENINFMKIKSDIKR